MPTTPQYSWAQTDTSVVITVTVRGFPREKVDVYVADVVLKVNFPPYLLLLDLFAAVDDQQATAVFESDVVRITLPKTTPGPWPSLEFEASKAELKERRSASMRARDERELKLLSQKREKRLEDGRLALRKQMDLEEAERRHLDDKKLQEKQSAESEVYAALSKYQSPSPSAAPALADATAPSRPVFDVDDVSDGEDDVAAEETQAKRSAPPAAATTGTTPAATSGSSPLTTLRASAGGASSSSSSSKAASTIWSAAPSADDEVAYVPPPRAVRKTTVAFTPRVFATPARESNVRQEEDWLAKNRHQMKNVPGVINKDASSIEERDPVWLKGKGDDFYRSGDFASAASAYTSALGLSPAMVPCLSNRAACYMRLRKLEECVADCAAALAALPQDASTTPQRLKLLARQGTALCAQGKYADAVAAFQTAGSLDTRDPAFATAAGRLSHLQELGQWKAKADEQFRAGSFDSAVAAFSKVLESEPRFVAALTNRAAAHFGAGHLEACIADCDAALDVLAYTSSASASASPSAAASPDELDCVPPKGSNRHTSFVTTTLIRRGTALSRLGRYAETVDDYAAALKMDPGNTSLAADLQRARARTAVSPADM